MNTQDIIKIAETYSSHTGLTLSTIGSYSVRDGKFFLRLSKGGSCTLKTAARIFLYFADNWPEDLAWPKGITRPDPTKKKVA